MLLSITVFSGQAQTKNYKALLRDLNKMLRSAEEYVSIYGSNFKIIQPFKVDSEDRLSVIIGGRIDGIDKVHKYEAPLNDLNDFFPDLKNEYEWMD